MTVSPVSNATPVSDSQPAPHAAPSKSSPASQPTDSVQLSPAALSHLKGGDVDGDGDGH